MRQNPKKLSALIFGIMILLGLQSFVSYRSLEPPILTAKENAWTTTFDGPAHIEKLINYSEEVVADIFRIEMMIMLPIFMISTAFIILLGGGIVLFFYWKKEDKIFS